MAADLRTDRARFRQMGSDAEVIVVGGPADAVRAAKERLDQLERRWSRFLPASEISEINRHAGHVVEVSDDTVLLVTLAVEGWRMSGGAVDPTVLGAVLRAGYDRSFEALQHPHRPACSELDIAACTDIVIADGMVRLPAGTGFDPGGVGKGLAADLVAAELMLAGAAGTCVNIGGDLRVMGVAPNGGGWTIDIEHPDEPSTITRIVLGDGGVATSTTRRRRWTVAGMERHHLIDVATGEPSTTDLIQASAIAGRAWVAEVLAKAALLRGSQRAFDIVPVNAGAIALGADGRVAMSPGAAPYLDGATEPPQPEPVGATR